MNNDSATPDDSKSAEGQGLNLAEVPMANVTPAQLRPADVIRGSHMWWVALLCLLVAIGLVWWSIPEQGVEVRIHFPEGHGLQAEDVVRFRGIDVGRVDQVNLNSDLTAVDVLVMLKPSAAALAREGTRFWIVRPELSLSGISGLETAVGHKYIGLLPGSENGSPKYEFDGLNETPPDVSENEGIEVTIRGERRHSVSSGSPLTCRGVDVGRIMSVGLSQDARHVDIRAKIFEGYEKLITTKTKFWPSSGVNVDFSLTSGMKLDMESLETLARGGVSLLTTENGGKPVGPGYVFQLYDSPEDGWVESARAVRLTQFQLRGAIPMTTTWKHNGLFGDSEKSSTLVGIPFRDSTGSSFVLVPRDALEPPKRAVEGTLAIKTAFAGMDPVPAAEVLASSDSTRLFAAFAVPNNLTNDWLIAKRDLRKPEGIENCLAVRATGRPGDWTHLNFPIERHQLSIDALNENNWFMNRFDGDKRVWHGAPVLSAKDGKVIGALLVGDHQATVVCFDGEIR